MNALTTFSFAKAAPASRVALLNALSADMRAFHNLAIADADEPATTYAAVEGQP